MKSLIEIQKMSFLKCRRAEMKKIMLNATRVIVRFKREKTSQKLHISDPTK